MGDGRGKKKRVIRVRPGDQRADTVAPVNSAAKKKAGVQIPDGERIPSAAVGASDSVGDSTVHACQRSECECDQQASRRGLVWRFYVRSSVNAVLTRQCDEQERADCGVDRPEMQEPRPAG